MGTAVLPLPASQCVKTSDRRRQGTAGAWAFRRPLAASCHEQRQLDCESFMSDLPLDAAGGVGINC